MTRTTDDRYMDTTISRLGVVASGWPDRIRGLPVVPLALIGVVLTVAVFAVGFRLGARRRRRRDG